MENVKDAPVKAREHSGGLLGKPAQWWENSRNFIGEVRAELKRVTWPSRREVYATTVVVIASVFFFGFYLGLVDIFLSWGFQKVLTYFGSGG